MKELELINFIKDNSKWEQLLADSPYYIKIKRENGLMIFSYNQIKSDFSIQLVRECRGIILEDGTFKVVCFPFTKFGNFGEAYVPIIDWVSARTEQKVDGSIIKLFFYNGLWRAATNGEIDASKSTLPETLPNQQPCPYQNFGELFNVAAANAGLDINILDKNCTYMFELVSPYNKVVVPYDKITIYHIGTRNNLTYTEFSADIGVQKPKSYPLHSLEECINAAKELPFSQEGYVVVDKNWQRIKVKSPQYVAAHFLKCNRGPNELRLIEMILTNETAEFLTYFPEYKAIIDALRQKIINYATCLQKQGDELCSEEFESRKDYAMRVKELPDSEYFFCLFTNKQYKAIDWIMGLSPEKLFSKLNIK